MKIKKQKVPKSSQEFIKKVLKNKIDEDGIIEITKNQYSVCFEYTDINYVKSTRAEKEQIFLDWVDFLNSFTPEFNLQIVTTNLPISIEEYKQKINYKLVGKEIDDELVKEFNSLMNANLSQDRNQMERKRFICISANFNSIGEAHDRFLDIETQINPQLMSLKSEINRLSTNDRICILYNFLKPCKSNLYKMESIDELNNHLRLTGRSLIDYLAPTSVLVKKNKVEIADNHVTVLYVKDYPTQLGSKFYSDLTLKNFDMTITMNILPTDKSKAIKYVRKKITGMKGNKLARVKRAAKNNIPPELAVSEETEEKLIDAQQLLKDLTNHNQKMFNLCMLIMIKNSNEEKLKEEVNAIKSIANANLVDVDVLYYQQLDGIVNCLPLGHNYLQVQRTLTSESTAIHIPFATKEINDPNGLYYGKNQGSGNLILLDRKRLNNGNAMYLGTSGGGKSFITKLEIESIKLKYPDDDIIILDPQTEYTDLTKALGGEVLEISPNSSTHINPFYIEPDAEIDAIKEKTEFIQALSEGMIGSENITAQQQTIIDRCCKSIYLDYFSDPNSKQPTFHDFHFVLKQQKEEEAGDLALIIERYVTGALNVFSFPTNINTSNQLLTINIEKLTVTLKKTGLLIALEEIKNRLKRNRKLGKNTWIFCDEFHLLLDNPLSSKYFTEFYKIARKYGGFMTAITQNVRNVLNSLDGQDMISNSEVILSFKQKPLDLNPLCNLLNISKQESIYLTQNKSGSGIMSVGGNNIAFSFYVPKSYKLFKLNHTDLKKINEPI